MISSSFSLLVFSLLKPQAPRNPALLGVGDLRHDRGGDVVHRHRQGTREETRQETPNQALSEEVETWEAKVRR